MRRLLVIGLGVVVTLTAAPTIPANAEPGVIESVFVEDSQSSMPVADPIFTQCLGYEGQVFEDRHGVFNLTTHTRGSLAGVTHVEATSAPTSSSARSKAPAWSTPAPPVNTT